MSRQVSSDWMLWTIGPLLSLLLLAVSVVRAADEFGLLAESDRVMASVGFGAEWGTALPRHITFYLFALIGCHLALGLLASLLAKAHLLTFPSTRTRPAALAAFWFVVLAASLLLANAHWYPASLFADVLPGLQAASNIGGPLVLMTAAAIGAAILLFLGALARGRSSGTRLRPSHLVVALLLLALPLLSMFISRSPSAAHPVDGKPHVILIGIDSLRCDVTSLGSGVSLTPRIDEFLGGATVFSDVISPLARTFPAWMAALTGRHPASINARFNLMPRAHIAAGDTLADALRAADYRTIYATDEVRFANIDQSYGFDQLITPPIGASDFVLGSFNDLPLPNILSATALGRWLFPHSFANRAAHVTYRPGKFTQRLLDEAQFDQPTFLAIHLTLAHWPYSWAGLEKPTTPDAYRISYAHAVQAVDDQFAAIMAGLDEAGVLSNALIVVFSDHGEALGGPTDTMLRQVGTADQIWSSVWGHGTSVMSPHQFQVLTAIRAFGPAIETVQGVIDVLASLEDIRPTIMDLLTGRPGENLDGVSLAPAIRGQSLGAEIGDRIRFTETDFNTPSVLQGQFDEKGALKEGAAYYELVPSSGWVQLKAERLPELIAAKERAAISATHHLAALPGPAGGEPVFLFSKRDNPLPMRLHGRPDASLEPMAARLWDALHERFPGEL